MSKMIVAGFCLFFSCCAVSSKTVLAAPSMPQAETEQFCPTPWPVERSAVSDEVLGSLSLNVKEPNDNWALAESDEIKNGMLFIHLKIEAHVTVTSFSSEDMSLEKASQNVEEILKGAKLIKKRISPNQVCFTWRNEAREIQGKVVIRKLSYRPEYSIAILGLWPANADKEMIRDFNVFAASAEVN